MFQSLAGSPSTSHIERSLRRLAQKSVSIPGGKPLHEPHYVTRIYESYNECFNPWREAPPRATACVLVLLLALYQFQSLAGSPSTSHTVRVFLFGVRVIGFNPWREAPPRATPQYQSASFSP